MKTKDYKPIVVFIIGSKDKSFEQVNNILIQIKNIIKLQNHFVGITITDDEISNIEIKCINPIILTKKEYEETFDLVEQLKKQIENV